jgi:hypothetical protein
MKGILNKIRAKEKEETAGKTANTTQVMKFFVGFRVK